MDQLFKAFGQTETGRQAQEGTGLGLSISRKFVQLLGGDIRVASPAIHPPHLVSHSDQSPTARAVARSGDRPQMELTVAPQKKSKIPPQARERNPKPVLSKVEGSKIPLGGPGTTFTFHIQIEVVASSTQDNGREAPNLISELGHRVAALAPNQPRYRLLIVDDMPDNRQVLRQLLEPFGFELREAENGQQAVEMWQEFQPHLIWMDMRMPGLDGYEATRQIKAKLKTGKRTSAPQTVIIALTASSFQEEKAEILAAGCDDFLRKPFRESELFQMMGKHIGVRYIYETPGEAPARATQDEASLLSDLPPELLTRLEEAIELSDIAQATDIINEIRPIHPEVAERLNQLLNNFEYHKMLEAINRLDVGVDDGFSEKSVDSGGG